MKKQGYVKPQVYRVTLQPEQAVLVCCSVPIYNKIVDAGSGRGRCFDEPGCVTGGSTINALSS